MTTPGFGAFSSAVARAKAEVRSQHCKPPTFRPVETARGTIRCAKCGGNLAELNQARDAALKEIQ